MKILGLIPARGGSKGVPKKNIKELGGHPLIAYTIASANKSGLLAKTILSSEDPEIIQTAKRYGIDTPVVRPYDLAEDHSRSIDVVAYTLNELEKMGEYYDAVCLLQPTSPFRSDDLVDRCVKKFIENNFDTLITVERVPNEFNPHWQFQMNSSGFLEIVTGEKDIISRRQDLPITYRRDGSIYLTKTSIIKMRHSFYGDKLGFIEVPSGQINIDTMNDWKKAELLITQNHVRN